jgi:hypothetical protein
VIAPASATRWVILAAMVAAAGCARTPASTEPLEPPSTETVEAAPLPPPRPEPAPPQPSTEPAAPQPPTRTGGRPEWWFTTPEYQDGRVRLCAEAIGPGMDGATRNAVDAGRRKLREALRVRPGRELPEESVDKASVAALPNPGSSNTHVGFVMISARVP